MNMVSYEQTPTAHPPLAAVGRVCLHETTHIFANDTLNGRDSCTTVTLTTCPV